MTPRPTQEELDTMTWQELINRMFTDKAWAQLYRIQGAKRAAINGTDIYTAAFHNPIMPRAQEFTFVKKSKNNVINIPNSARVWLSNVIRPTVRRWVKWIRKGNQPKDTYKFLDSMIDDGIATRRQLEEFFPYVWKYYSQYMDVSVGSPDKFFLPYLKVKQKS